MMTFVAVLVGLYGRFMGLGAAPLGVDEFYISRSVDNLLRTGLPEFLCGGYYNRGLAYQYIVGAVRLFGVSPEVAGRTVAAISSLAVLPAVYLLGRSVHSKTAGLLAVIVMALSIWEIEMARFARMYAPFQAVFAWYLVFLLRYVADGNRKSLVAMIVLSLLGALTWEGAALIGVLNLLPALLRQREGRLLTRDWAYLGGMLVLFAILYVMSTTDLRTFTDIPPYAHGYNALASAVGSGVHDRTLSVLFEHPIWGVFAAACIALALASLRWLWTLRAQWLTALGLVAALAAALAHQFLIAASILVLLSLSGLYDWRGLIARGGRTYLLAIIVCGIFWASFGLGSDAWIGARSSFTPASLEIVARKLLGFPNVIDNIARPWGRALPVMSLMLAVAWAGLACASMVRNESPPSNVTRLLMVVLLMVLAVGSISGERQETRYLFFLYPALIVLAIAAAARLLGRSRIDAAGWDARSAVLCCAVLAGFAASGDFQPRHLANIDSAAFSFRVGMRPGQIDHYYPHNDVRSAGQWLAANLRSGDLVVNGIPSLDQYYDRADFFFLDEQDNRYKAYSCEAGAKDRWTTTPLLYGTQQLASRLANGRTVFLVAYPSITRRIVDEASAQGWTYRTAWTSIDGGVHILVFNPK